MFPGFANNANLQCHMIVSSKLEAHNAEQSVHVQAKVTDAQSYICCSHVSILHFGNGTLHCAVAQMVKCT